MAPAWILGHSLGLFSEMAGSGMAPAWILGHCLRAICFWNRTYVDFCLAKKIVIILVPQNNGGVPE